VGVVSGDTLEYRDDVLMGQKGLKAGGIEKESRSYLPSLFVAGASQLLKSQLAFV